LKFTITSTKQLKCYCYEVSEIKTMKFIKCLTAWFQIRKTLQLLLILKISRESHLTSAFKSFRKRDRSFYNKKSLVVWIFLAETSSKSCEDWTELIFSKDQRINHFFRCVYRFVISLNTRNGHTKHVWFILLITWWIMWLFLHGCTFCAGIGCSKPDYGGSQ